MNIFILDSDIRMNAVYHCDKHVVKMILEYAQLLCTALHSNPVLSNEVGISVDKIPYKVTHKNHPCARWARSNVANYSYLCELFYNLCEEYTHRYNKTHLTEDKMRPLLYSNDNYSIEDLQAPLCMPDEYKIGGVIESYREYYKKGKTTLHRWTNRAIPDFILN